MNTTTAKAHALIAAQSTATLVTSLRAVASPKSTEERMVRAWIIDALEDRFPAASAAVEVAFDSAELRAMESSTYPVENVDYVAVLLAAIPGVAA